MKMKKHNVQTQIYVFEMPDIKESVLSAIYSMGTHSIVDEDQQISNTDWHLNANTIRPYFDIVDTHINKCIDEITADTLYKKASINNFWFQQYNKGDYHGWHNHAGSTYSSVYYVELPDNTSTTFESNGKEFNIDVKEGDFIVFPSVLRHCSKANKTDETKTVVAMNIDIT